MENCRKSLQEVGFVEEKGKQNFYNVLSFFMHIKTTPDTVKPLITNTSEEFIKCRLDNLSMSFILYYGNFSICENK